MENRNGSENDEEVDKRAIEEYRYFKKQNRHRYRLSRIYRSVQRYGAGYTFNKYRNAVLNHIRYRTFYRRTGIDTAEREKERNTVFQHKVKFSILVPLYNTRKDFLTDLIHSCLIQTYKNFELILADGSDDEHSYVENIVRTFSDKRIIYKKIENRGISDNTNECLRSAAGEYIVLADHDDMLHESALYWLCRAVNEKNADFIYTDEAVFSKNPARPDDYHMKTDFAPDDLNANNYICHITCFRKDLLKENEGLRKQFDGSQDFDLVLRLTERAHNIIHVPKVLYFWRNHKNSVASDISAKAYAVSAGRHAVEAHLDRIGVKASVSSCPAFPAIYHVDYNINGDHKVTFIVMNHEDTDVFDKKYLRYISVPYEVKEIYDLQDRNNAAKEAEGDIIIFIDSAMIPGKKSWADELVKAVQNAGTGAAGPQVLYKDGLIRDLGIVLGAGNGRIAGNAAYRFRKDFPGYNGNRYFIHDVAAVSDTCFAVRKNVFISVGGFDKKLSDWYSGIDLSMKLNENGFINVINPYSVMRFMRDEDYRDAAGNFPANKEDRMLRIKWGAKLKRDPFYNTNFSRNNTDYSLK